MDGTKDYAKLYVNTPGELKEFRVSVSETRWGKPDFTYTDKVTYQHKVYHFQIPLTEIETSPDHISIAFAAYGTEAPPNLDFGDAPDPTYPTLLANDGARHQVWAGESPFLGAEVDLEPDGQPDAFATGDDLSGTADEDGVAFTSLLVPGQTASVTVTAANVVQFAALDAWIDFTGDGDWNDPGEQIFMNQSLSDGDNLLSFFVPSGAATGITFARFRCSTSGYLSPTGEALDGEVEDYAVTILSEFDFGDAPDPTYPTLLAGNGARHRLFNPPVAVSVVQQPFGPILGISADPDADGQPNPAADGDDGSGIDDEDGVIFTSLLLPGQTADITVTTSNVISFVALDAWIDFNGDGDWSDAGEQIFSSTSLAPGANLLNFSVPANALSGTTYARFRLSTGGNLSPTGEADDGEVEDYAVTIQGLDFGDAPDPSYPTLLASDGARHVIVSGLQLGDDLDGEADGQPNGDANGDDLAGIADEDGVVFNTFPFVPGQPADVTVTASAAGYLDAWVDFNGDGDWGDPGEQVFTNELLAAGSSLLTFTVPANAALATTFARFRFSSAGNLLPTGQAADGEVEDYQVAIAEEVEALLDFGDAPSDREIFLYPTLRADDGARHAIVAGFCLGADVDAEPDGQPDAGAAGDDSNGTDDEDGVIFNTSLVAGQSAVITVTASAAGFLDAWVDFNADGDWTDLDEQILSVPLTAGANALIFPVPGSAALGTTFSRFRFSSAGDLLPTGQAPDGEVEDHPILIEEEAFAEGLDFGDAPDPTYPTLLASSGARHIFVSGGLRLGVKIDAEVDGQPDAAAAGDDAGPDTGDDEDGVVFTTPFVQGQSASVAVIASASGFLNAWIDFTADGDWSDPGEQIFANTALTAGLSALNFLIPETATLGPTFVRFRFSSLEGIFPTGEAPDGEVEDYLVLIEEAPPEPSPRMDYGDAPDPTYPTLRANNGARHLIDEVYFLGTLIDSEIDGQPGPAATGDDVDGGASDEDGVVFNTPLRGGQAGDVTVIASTAGRLDAWIDFDRNGSWAVPGEQIFTSELLVAGPNTLSFAVPETAMPGRSFARFRFSSQGGLLPIGEAADGEVEDYLVTILALIPPPLTGLDTDGDGIRDREEDACDSGLDTKPDRLQCWIASFKAPGGQCVTLEMPATPGSTQICFQRVQDPVTLYSPPPAPPSWVSLPFGLLTFRIANVPEGNCTTVTVHSSGAPQSQVPQTYWKYGITHINPAVPHWYDFSYNGRTGADFIDDSTMVLHLCDGERGDHDLAINAEILEPGAPAHIAERSKLYFPYISNRGGGLNIDEEGDKTELAVINKAPYAIAGTITFYQENGTMAGETITIPSPSGPPGGNPPPFPGTEVTIAGLHAVTIPGNGKLTIPSTLPRNEIAAGSLVIPSNAASAIVTADGDVVGYAQFTSPAGKRYAAPGAARLTRIMTAPFLRVSETTGEGWRTGFGIFNPGTAPVTVQFHDDTIAGMPPDFTLQPKASRFLWVENPEEGVRNIEASGTIAAVEVFEYLPATTDTDMAAILLGNQNASDLCVPALFFDPGQGTSVGLGNPPGAGSAALNAIGYDAGLTETSVSLGSLVAGEMKSAYLTTIFPPDILWTRLTGDVVQGLGSYFEDQENQPPAPASAEKIATVNLNNLKFRDGCFDFRSSAEGTPRFALVNPGSAPADLIAFAYNEEGTIVAQSDGILTVVAQTTFGLTDLFGGADLTGATSIRVVSIMAEEELCGLEVIPVGGRWQGLPVLQ